jgi:N-methylhydantoinase A
VPARCTPRASRRSWRSAACWSPGLLLTDLRADFATTRLAALGPAALPGIAEAFETLRSQAEHWFDTEGIAPNNRRISRTIDMRYAGQNYEIAVPLPEGPVGPATPDALAAGFSASHQRLYGFTADEDPMQLVTYRLEAVGLVPKATITTHPDAEPDAASALLDRRNVWLAEAGSFIDCPIYDRALLAAGNRIDGPAVIEQMDATTLLLPGMQARADSTLNLILEWP